MLPLTIEESVTETEAASPAKMVHGVPTTVADRPEFVNVTSTEDAPKRVFAAITMTTAVAVAHVHDVVAVPELGVAPTFAVHAKPAMKFEPVTVMVLLRKADTGAIKLTVGAATMVSGVPATVAERPEFVNVTSTDEAAIGVSAEITTIIAVAVAHVHDVAAVPELGVAPTLAVHAKPAMKFAPVTVMVHAQEGAGIGESRDVAAAARLPTRQ